MITQVGLMYKIITHVAIIINLLFIPKSNYQSIIVKHRIYKCYGHCEHDYTNNTFKQNTIVISDLTLTSDHLNRLFNN